MLHKHLQKDDWTDCPDPRDGIADQAGQLQSICWASAAVGGILSAYFSGSLVQDYGTRYTTNLHTFPQIVLISSARPVRVNDR